MSISVVGDGLLLSQKGDLVIGDGTAEGRLAVGTNGQVLTASSTDSLGVKWIDQPSFTQKYYVIGYSSTTGTVASMSFSSITQTYDDLRLICIARNSATSGGARTFLIRMNDATTGYRWSYDGGGPDGTNYASSDAATSIEADVVVPDSAEQRWGIAIADFIDYTNTTSAKSVIVKAGRVNNQAVNGYRGKVMVVHGILNSTSAITKISVSSNTWAVGSMTQNSTIILLGIKRS
jgi:hypothetical protein